MAHLVVVPQMDESRENLRSDRDGLQLHWGLAGVGEHLSLLASQLVKKRTKKRTACQYLKASVSLLQRHYPGERGLQQGWLDAEEAGGEGRGCQQGSHCHPCQPNTSGPADNISLYLDIFQWEEQIGYLY